MAYYVYKLYTRKHSKAIAHEDGYYKLLCFLLQVCLSGNKSRMKCAIAMILNAFCERQNDMILSVLFRGDGDVCFVSFIHASFYHWFTNNQQ